MGAFDLGHVHETGAAADQQPSGERQLWEGLEREHREFTPSLIFNYEPLPLPQVALKLVYSRDTQRASSPWPPDPKPRMMSKPIRPITLATLWKSAHGVLDPS